MGKKIKSLEEVIKNLDLHGPTNPPLNNLSVPLSKLGLDRLPDLRTAPTFRKPNSSVLPDPQSLHDLSRALSANNFTLLSAQPDLGFTVLEKSLKLQPEKPGLVSEPDKPKNPPPGEFAKKLGQVVEKSTVASKPKLTIPKAKKVQETSPDCNLSNCPILAYIKQNPVITTQGLLNMYSMAGDGK